VVLQDHGLLVAQSLADAKALVRLQHHAREVIEQRMVLVEDARVLRQRVEPAAQR